MFVVQMHASSLFNHATLEEEVALARKVCVRGMPMAKVKVKGTAHSACAWSRRLTIPARAGLWLECWVVARVLGSHSGLDRERTGVMAGVRARLGNERSFR